jgi:RNA polymerase sigma factor (sigma-70 family)
MSGMVGLTDAELLVASGADAGAFRELYDRYSYSVGRFFMSRTRDRDAALDLTAETFAQAWFSRERFEDHCGGTAGPWLFAIARNVLNRSVRKQYIETRARMRLELDAMTGPRSAPQADAWLDGLDQSIDAALDALPGSQRRAVLQRSAGEDYADIAADLGVSPVAVRIKVSRGLGSLRAILKSASSDLQLEGDNDE